MNKTRNNNRSRKAKATVRTKSSSKFNAVRCRNTSKINRLLGRFPQAQYDLHIEFMLTDAQDMNDPADWLYTRNPNFGSMEYGSGYSFVSNCRDFHWCGTQADIEAILREFKDSPFRIADIYIYPSDWKENEDGSKFCLTTKRGWNTGGRTFLPKNRKK
jgi:hypothetical protein